MSTKITAFIGGNTWVNHIPSLNQLYVANDDGIVKIYRTDIPDSEPESIDIPEYFMSFNSFGDKVFLTTTAGELAVLNSEAFPTENNDYTTIYTSSKPLRDARVINEGNRIICGGDAQELVLIDRSQADKVEKFPLDDKLVSISYNALGELIAVGLADGKVHIFSVSNEKPELVEILETRMPVRQNTSVESIDFHDSHSHELVCTSCLWSSTGEAILVPTPSGSVKSFARNDWQLIAESPSNPETLVSFTVSPSNKFVALLFKNGTINIHNAKTFNLIKTVTGDFASAHPINLAWAKKAIYVGSTQGDLHTFPISLDDEADDAPEPASASVSVSDHASAPTSASVISEVNKLFLEEASDSETEDLDVPADYSRKRDALDDSRIIDEDDDEDANVDDPYKYHNKTVDAILSDRRKRARFSSPAPVPSALAEAPSQELIPYSPGSTPWIKSVNSGTSATKRRYLFMNAVGYSWSVKSASGDATDVQKSITVSFFDRSVNKDYHFIDQYDYDLCSMNERGILLGCSGFQAESNPHKGRIFYRHHVGTNDSWDRQIPLLTAEYITSICITSSAEDNSGDSIIVVGTNFGYLRFFNLYGLCINIMKVSPVISLISSAINTVFSIHYSGKDNFTYSIINVPEDYKFYQQECNLPIKSTRGPLIKGLFFNDHSDPCLVAGHDDTLVVLSHWREANNARWIPLLNCTDAVSDFGVSESKKNWKCWPLGLQEDKSVCLILKNNDIYPGFPLPLPIELDLRLPTKCFKSLLAKKTEDYDEDDDDEIADGSDEVERKLQKVKEEDPEEEFLRVSTLGKLLASSLADLGDEEEHLDTLKNYGLVFDKSLLKLFNSACQESRLNKAFSVAKLIKNDKALLAATKIAERHSFSNLTAKINKLREDLLEMLEEAEEEE